MGNVTNNTIRDMLSGSVIKFTYDTDKYGVVHHEEDSVYFYWKENERDLIKITTSIDPLYPEIHSYEAHYKKLNSTGKEMQGGSVELLANCETRYMFYKEKTVAKVTSSGGSYMSAYITMPDGSNIMTPFVRVENYEKGVEFMNTLFNSFELYTAGGYTEQQGEYEHSDHLYVSRDLDDKNMAEQVVLPDYVTELFRSIEAKSENYFVFFTENGWIDGKMVVPNLKKISGDISVDTDVVLQDSIEYIDATLWGCAYPTRITMPKNLKEFNPINHRTIGDQEQTIKYLSFQESEQDAIIGNSGFSYLTVLEEVHLSNNIVYIGKHAFIGDFKLNSINLPANLKYLGDSAFERTVLTGTYVIPDGTIYMGNGVFPEGVDTLVIPASVEKLGWQNAKTIITTAGSLAEAYALERGKELIIITEEEMEQYQSIYR